MQERLRLLCAALAECLPEGQWKNIGRWLCAVVVLTALMWGVMAGVSAVDRLAFSRLTAGTGLSIHTGESRVELLPPGLVFPQLSVRTRGKNPLTLQLTNVRLRLGLAWPVRPVIAVRSELFGGTLEAEAAFSGWLSPHSLTLAADWKHLNVRSIQGLLGEHGGSQFVDVLQGRLSGTLATATPLAALRTASLEGEGNLTVGIDNVNAVSNIPLLRSEKLQGIAGRVRLDWENGNIRLQEVRITNPLLRLAAQGSARAGQPLSSSTVQLRITVGIDPKELRLLLLPPRSREAFASGNPVDVLLNGPINNPVFGLASSPQADAAHAGYPQNPAPQTAVEGRP